MNKLLLAFDTPSDLSALLLGAFSDARQVSFAELGREDAENYDALAVLGGAEDMPVILGGRARIVLERFRELGKPVFVEYIASVGELYAGDPKRLSHHRMAYVGGDFAQLACGDLFDPHYNELIPYYGSAENAVPILTCHPYLNAHDRCELPPEELLKGESALWITNDSTLICAFRLANFNLARLAPVANWQTLIKHIVRWLAGTGIEVEFPRPICRHVPDTPDSEVIAAGLRWFREAGMLINGGADGVREGFLHHIDAKDGKQLRTNQVRADCTGEVGGAFLFDWLLRGNRESKRIADACEDYVFDCLQVKDGVFAGMVRWSESAWRVCYQDDVARAIMPTLMRALLDRHADGRRRFADACHALDFLVATTGSDGLRVPRTDCWQLDEAGMEALRNSRGHRSAHYNAWYLAALLFAHLAGETRRGYLEVAEKGLQTLMSVYPDIIRIQTQTQETARLVLPLALLYKATGKPNHLEMLHRVCADLEKWRHPSGGILEWDEDYRGTSYGVQGGECGLLARNGDPVCDNLYTNNWLLVGYAWALHATGDPVFAKCWDKTAAYLRLAQIHSADRNLDGGWTRAFDVSRNEIYGMPHDIGWSPCCMETGWTIAEIIMGFQLRRLLDKSYGE